METVLLELEKETEEEKSKAESRLLLWAEEERQRIDNHITSEKKFIEERYMKNLHKIELEKKALENRMQENEERFKRMIAETEEEMTIAGEDLKDSELEVERCLGNLETYAEKYNAGT